MESKYDGCLVSRATPIVRPSRRALLPDELEHLVKVGTS